ncbi:MAG: septum formation protein Maf [Clostridia bacterium]|nr:septum formation protein Maf [Clostridia bacterium]
MQTKKILLASGSPRRKELLARMGLEFGIMPCDAEEKYDPEMNPSEIARYLGRLKAEIVNKMVDGYVVIGADTIVVVDGHILGKPTDRHEAYSMLKKLSGSWHEVITGVCVFDGEECITDHVITRVHFVEMTEGEIEEYINTDEPYDKAGAYGVQGLAGMYIDSIEGDYYNIMGFPMAKIRSMLKEVSAMDGVKGQ